MNTSTSLISAVILAGAALGAQSSFAADISHAPEAVSLVDGSSFFGGQFTGGQAGSSFSDIFTFTTASAGVLTAELQSLSGNIKNGLDITGFGLYGTGGLILGGTQLSTGLTDLWTLTSANLAAGNYSVQIMGTVNSNSAGKYYSSVSLAPVPEPETCAMMFAGLGLLAVSARRRRKNQSAA